MPFSVDMKWINEAEEKLSMKLPKSYVDYLSKSNGGEIATEHDDWQLYPVWDKTDRKTLSRTCNDIVRETGQAKECTGFPDDAIAIGSNGCGDQLIFKRGDDAVYMWEHETGKITLQASSFAELVDGNGN